jgi:hypothetical protein
MTKREAWAAIEQLMPEIVFRPGNAVGLAHLHRPRDAAATEKLCQLLNQVGRRPLPMQRGAALPDKEHQSPRVDDGALRRQAGATQQ